MGVNLVMVSTVALHLAPIRNVNLTFVAKHGESTMKDNCLVTGL